MLFDRKLLALKIFSPPPFKQVTFDVLERSVYG